MTLRGDSQAPSEDEPRLDLLPRELIARVPNREAGYRILINKSD